VSILSSSTFPFFLFLPLFSPLFFYPSFFLFSFGDCAVGCRRSCVARCLAERNKPRSSERSCCYPVYTPVDDIAFRKRAKANIDQRAVLVSYALRGARRRFGKTYRWAAVADLASRWMKAALAANRPTGSLIDAICYRCFFLLTRRFIPFAFRTLCCSHLLQDMP